MTQVINENGDVTPATVMRVDNVSITSMIVKENRGYNALLLSAVKSHKLLISIKYKYLLTINNR